MTDFTEAGPWSLRAACADPANTGTADLFFARTALERRPARNLCLNTCPVRKDCLVWALEKRQIWGVWGGCDEGELRRALWVDSKGQTLERCRYPHCPYCKARPNRLHVISACSRAGRISSWVQCSACDFSWSASSSVLAVKSYWRMRRRLEQRNLRAKAPSRRIPGLRAVPVGVLPSTTVDAAVEAQERQIYGMVASGSR